MDYYAPSVPTRICGRDIPTGAHCADSFSPRLRPPISKSRTRQRARTKGAGTARRRDGREGTFVSKGRSLGGRTGRKGRKREKNAEKRADNHSISMADEDILYAARRRLRGRVRYQRAPYIMLDRAQREQRTHSSGTNCCARLLNARERSRTSAKLVKSICASRRP